MTQLKFGSAALIALALTACNRNPTDNIAIDNDAASPTANADLPTDPATQPDARTMNAENAAASAIGSNLIPAAFRGRWGLTPADCTSTRGDAKGLLTIGDARLTFYESKGTPVRPMGATATSFDARYSFIGEGQTWKRTERLKLVNDRLQRRTDAEPGQEPPVNLTYQRCGA